MTRARDLASLGDNTSKLEQQGMVKIIPSSVAVGSGTGSASASGTVTFSGVSSISINGVFSSTYDNYRIVFGNLNGSGAQQDVGLQLRKNGVNNSSSIYYRQYLNASSTSVSGARVATSSNWIVFAVRDQGPFQAILDIFNPNNATIKTGALGFKAYGSTSENSIIISSYTHDLSSSADFDGFTLTPNSGTASGTVLIYGYN
jgi:hypothetical protein